MAGAYVAGGLVPLLPYIATSSLHRALPLSVSVTLLALLVFGWAKARRTGAPALRGALQTRS